VKTGVEKEMKKSEFQEKVESLPALTDKEMERILIPVNNRVNPIDEIYRSDLEDNSEVQEYKDKAEMIDKNEDLFKGIGQLHETYAYYIELYENARPVKINNRRVAKELWKPFKKELDKMEEEFIIAKMLEECSDWENSFVLVIKDNGSIRFCLDPTKLNQWIRRPTHSTKNLEDIIPDLAGCKFFSNLDVRSGYWNIPLTKRSQVLTCFNTPFGRYKFLRLPFGLNSAQDIFQMHMDSIFGSIDNVHVIADDILIAARTKREHDKALHRIIVAARKSGVKLNGDKSHILEKQVKFFGHILTKEGIQPDPKKFKAIAALSAPSNKQELQSFLGLFNYLSKFLPTSLYTTEMRKNLQGNDATNKWTWTERMDAEFNNIKKNLVEKLPTLQYYNPNPESGMEVTIECDASKKGIGAVLLQNDVPIHFASKAFTKAEQNYSNIEREMLAVSWSIQYFKHYVFAKNFVVYTDHSPLVSLQHREFQNIPPRLQ